VKFKANVVLQTVSVLLIGDSVLEPDQTFSLRVSSASGASISHDTGVGMIVNDDAQAGPRIAVGDVFVREGDLKSRSVFVPISVATPLGAPVGLSATTTQVSARGGSKQSSGADYVATTRSVSFGANTRVAYLKVTLLPDALHEAAESFRVSITGHSGIVRSTGTVTIVNDDAMYAPFLPPDLSSGADTGRSDVDNITADATPAFLVDCVPGDTLKLFSNGTVVGQRMCAATGLSSGSSTYGPVYTNEIAASILSDGQHAMTATFSNNGDESAPSLPLAVTIDSTAPSPAGAPDMTAETDDGVSNGDSVTSKKAPSFTGTCAPSTLVELFAGPDLVRSGTCPGAGVYALGVRSLPLGLHELTATLTDTAGNLSAPSLPLTVTITAPSGGSLWSWGACCIDSQEQLFSQQHSPVQMDPTPHWASVTGNSRALNTDIFVAALRTDGTLWAWGSNRFGALGNGTSTRTATPTEVAGGGTDWATVSAGGMTVAATKTDGTLWAWGHGSDGKLGIGNPDITGATTPRRVGTDADWLTVSVGASHMLAIKTDGTLWSWGANFYGQLGDGSRTSRSTPVQVGSARNWATVNAGPWESFGIKTDGTMWAWGDNTSRDLGSGSTARDVLTPEAVTTNFALNGSTWTAVQQGPNGSGGLFPAFIARASDGSWWAWGGTVAHPQPANAGLPSEILGANVIAMASGDRYGIGLHDDGTLWASGLNGCGQLGDGTQTPRPIFEPVQVGAGTSWISVAATTCYTAAIGN